MGSYTHIVVTLACLQIPVGTQLHIVDAAHACLGHGWVQYTNTVVTLACLQIPVGRRLHIVTRGTGLGQMQVRVEYNVPVETNADCRYNVTITRRTMSHSSRRQSP